MQTLLLFYSALTESEKISSLKQGIENYIGKRMILDECPGCPSLMLNDVLNNEDRSFIKNMVEKANSQTMAIFFVETPNVKAINDQIIVNLTTPPEISSL